MKIALIQQEYAGSKERTILNSVEMIEEAAVKGADVVVLQELHQSEYFCINEDSDKFSYADDFEKDLLFWGDIAKRNSIVIVTTLFEKRAPGIYHNSAIVFEKDGTIAGKYRKMHIPDDPGFYEKFYFTPGDLGFNPIDTSAGRLGVLICWDQWFCEAARIMALKGAEVLIYPTAIGWFDDDDEKEKQRQLEAWITISRSHAISNSLFVVCVNRVGKEYDKSGAIEGIRFWGNSFVCGPQGEFLCRTNESEEVVKVVELDMNRLDQVRDIWPFFRDRRIDFYKGLKKRYIFKP